MKNFNLKFVVVSIMLIFLNNLSETKGYEDAKELKMDLTGAYINDTIRISLTISNYDEQNYYFQFTNWGLFGVGLVPNNVSFRNEPLFFNYVIFHKFENDGFFDSNYAFPVFDELPKLVSLQQGEEFKINFQYVNKDRKIHINVDSLEYQIRISYINETDYQNLTYLSDTDFTYTESSIINNLNIELLFGKYIYLLPEKSIKISECDSKLLYALFSKYLIAKGKMKIQTGK